MTQTAETGRQHGNARTIARNVAANWGGLAASMAVAFFLSPFLVHRLGDTMYGLWALLLAVTGYMGLLDAGLKVSVVKYVSRFSATSDTAALSRIISTSLALYGGISVLIVVLGVAAVPLLPVLFSIPAEALPTARVVLVITAVNMAITLPMSVFNGVLAGRQRYDYMNLIAVSVLLVRSAVIVAVVASGYGIVALGLCHTGAQLAAGALLARSALGEVRGVRIRPSAVTGKTVRMLYGYGLFVLLNNVAMFLLFNSAEVLVGAFTGAAAVTYYAIAGSLMQHLSKLIGVMTQVLLPYASSQEASGDAAALRRTVVIGTKACLLIALPATATIMIAGRTFIEHWMGPSYAEVAGPLLVVIAVGRLFWLSQSSTGNILLGVGRHRVLTLTNLGTGIASIVLGVIFIQRWGLLGLAAGMAIPILVTQGIVLPLVTLSAFGLPAGFYWREAYLPPLLATVPYALVLGSLMLMISPAGLLELAGVVVLAMPVFAAGAYLICFTADQRRAILQGPLRWLPVSVTGSHR